MLLVALPPVATWNTLESGLKSDSTSLPSSAPLDYPYIVSPSIYPSPSNISTGGNASLLRLASSSTGTFYLLFTNSSSKQLWLDVGSYNGPLATTLWGCQSDPNTQTCRSSPTLYLSWGRASTLPILSETSPITADALTVEGSTIVAAATSSGVTTMLSTVNAGASWSTLGSTTGTVTSIAADPSEVVETALSSGSVTANTFSLSTGLAASSSVGPAGAVQNASATWVPITNGVKEVITETDPSAGTVLVYGSINGGNSFSSGTTIGTINETVPPSYLSSIGQSHLIPPGGIPGQVASITSGTGLIVFYTTRNQGRVVGSVVVASNGGTQWSMPMLIDPTRGSLQDPSLTSSPAGDVYATWRDSGNGSWEVDQAVIAPDGQLVGPVTPLPASGGDALGVASAGPPAVAVDWLQRPLLVWPTASPTGGTDIAYSGAFLSTDAALAALTNVVSDPLLPADFAPSTPAPSNSTVQSFLQTVASDDATTAGEATLSGAQNETIRTLLPYVSHYVYSVTGGPPDPPESTTPISAVSGPFAANTYLAVYAGWVLNSIGGGIAASPLVTAGSSTPSNVVSPPVTSSTTSNSYDGEQATVKVTPTPVSPTDVILLTSAVYPSYSTYHAAHIGDCGYSYENSSGVARYYSNVTLGSGSVHSFTSTSGTPDVYLANLTPDSNFTWAATFTGVYLQTYDYDICGTVKTGDVYPETMSPKTISMSVSGNTTTELALVASPALLTGDWPSRGSPASGTINLTANWSNTVEAQDDLWLNYTPSGSSAGSYSSNQFVINETHTFAPLPTGDYFQASLTAATRAGGPNSSYVPAISDGFTLASPDETANLDCTFNLTNPDFHDWGAGATNISGDQAEIYWYANTSGFGAATYYEYGTGANLSVTDVQPIKVAYWSSNQTYEWEYETPLHGLLPFGIYFVLASVGIGSGCLLKNRVIPFNFLSSQELTLTEQDLPYDSITQTGGGADISWSIPSLLYDRATFSSGAVLWSGASTAVTIPVESSGELMSWGCSAGYCTTVFDLQDLPQVNITYGVSVYLNYSIVAIGSQTQVNATGGPLYFSYLHDRTGDGLSDEEKSLGWWVEGAPGAWVSPNVAAYATNGLVDDFIEKEYGLNPLTIDSESSHMLDTWNLTFDLGVGNAPHPSGNATLPATGFEYWYENTSYFPFRNGTVASGLSNLTPSAKYGITSGDGSPWASKALWTGSGSGSALSQLEALITEEGVGWLRAETGTYDGQRVMTVWGKLSWGANPLAWSTNGEGVPDGATIDPLGVPDVNVTITGFSESSISSGDGVGIFIHSNSTKNSYIPSGQVNYNGYSVSKKSTGSSVSWSGTYTVNFQVSPTDQNVSLNLSVVTATSTKPTYAWHNAAPVIIDLLNSTSFSKTLSGTGYTISIAYEASTVFSKAPTTIIVPEGNSTLSNLPHGLERYTGEQDFMLLEINGSSNTSLTVSGIPYVNETGPNGISPVSYSLTLHAGMNNILVPRGYFETSLLGEALLNYTCLNATERAYQGALEGSYNPVFWRARVTGASYAGTSHAKGTSSYIQVYSNSNQNCTAGSSECGTLPGNPSAEGQVPTYAIQSVFALNVSALSGWTQIIAGLLLNSSGNFTAAGFAATPYLGSLGIGAEVYSALANPVEFNSGAYGVPVYSGTGSSPSWWGAVGADIWNAISGTYQTLISIPWAFEQAAGAFEAYLGKEATVWGLSGLVSQTESHLQAIADGINWAIQSAAIWIKAQISSMLSQPTKSAEANVGLSVANTADSMSAYSTSGGPTSSPDTGEIGQFSAGTSPLLAITFVVAILATVALTLMLPFETLLGSLSLVLLGILAAALSFSASYSSSNLRPTLSFSTPGGELDSAGSFFDQFLGSSQAAEQISGGVGLIEVLASWSVYLVSALAAAMAGAGPLVLALGLTAFIAAIILYAYAAQSGATGWDLVAAYSFAGLLAVLAMIDGYFVIKSGSGYVYLATGLVVMVAGLIFAIWDAGQALENVP